MESDILIKSDQCRYLGDSKCSRLIMVLYLGQCSRYSVDHETAAASSL